MSASVVSPVSEKFGTSMKADLVGSRWWQRCLLIATVAWIVYEWGAGNETVTPWLLVRVISSTSGVGSIVATALIGFCFTALQQLASGFTTAAGFSMFPRTAQTAWSKLSRRLDPVPGDWATMTWPARALVVFALGTTAVVLLQATATGQVGVRRHRRTVVQAAVLCGALVGTAGALVAAMVWGGREIPWLQTPTELLLRVLGNPLFWIGLLVIFAVASRLRRPSARAAA